MEDVVDVVVAVVAVVEAVCCGLRGELGKALEEWLRGMRTLAVVVPGGAKVGG